MTIEEIRKGVPDKTATHYLNVICLGLIYIKYIDSGSCWFDKSINKWIKTSSYTEAKPLF